MPPFKASFHPHIEVKKFHSNDSNLQKFLQALYPQEAIEWIATPNFNEIDTYVLFHLCAYGEEELPSLRRGIWRARQLLDSLQLNPKAQLLIIFYRDLKVAFPERKLQREKFMSEMVTEEILKQETPEHQKHINIAHEFGTNNLQDTLRQLTGTHFYFEVI